MNDLILSSPLPLDQNPAAVYIASLPAETGRRTQKQCLCKIAEILGCDLLCINWGALRYQHTSAIRTRLMEEYKPATVNKMLCALRGTLKHAKRLGQISGEDYTNAVDLQPVTGETLPTGRYITRDEIQKMLDTCDSSPAGIRDIAIILVFYMVGLRRFEAASLNLRDYDPTTGKLSIVGKRSKERVSYIANEAKDALDRWLLVRGNKPGAIFLPVDKSDKIIYKDEITPQSVYNWWCERRELAGIPECSPHSGRRSRTSNLLSAGVDPFVIARDMGWKNVNMIRVYDRRSEQEQFEAAQKLTMKQ
jgi:integrase/recombinase XerD